MSHKKTDSLGLAGGPRDGFRHRAQVLGRGERGGRLDALGHLRGAWLSLRGAVRDPLTTPTSALRHITDVGIKGASAPRDAESATALFGQEKLLLDGHWDAWIGEDAAHEAVYSEKAEKLVLSLYRERLAQSRTRFPAGFWTGHQGRLNGKIIVGHLVKQLKIPVNRDLPSVLDQSWFKKRKLVSYLDMCFSGHPYEAVAFIFSEQAFDPTHPEKPHQFHPWDGTVYKWEPAAMRQAVRHMVGHTGWAIDATLPAKANSKWFIAQNLETLHTVPPGKTFYQLLADAYPKAAFNPHAPHQPHTFHPWDAGHYEWEPAAMRQAIKDRIEYHEKWKVDARLAQNVTRPWLLSTGFSFLRRYGYDPEQVLRFAYPKAFDRGVLAPALFIKNEPPVSRKRSAAFYQDLLQDGQAPTAGKAPSLLLVARLVGPFRIGQKQMGHAAGRVLAIGAGEEVDALLRPLTEAQIDIVNPHALTLETIHEKFKTNPRVRSRLGLYRADARRLSGKIFPERSYDVVYIRIDPTMVSPGKDATDERAIMQQAMRVLKPGGILIYFDGSYSPAKQEAIDRGEMHFVRPTDFAFFQKSVPGILVSSLLGGQWARLIRAHPIGLATLLPLSAVLVIGLVNVQSSFPAIAAAELGLLILSDTVSGLMRSPKVSALRRIQAAV